VNVETTQGTIQFGDGEPIHVASISFHMDQNPVEIQGDSGQTPFFLPGVQTWGGSFEFHVSESDWSPSMVENWMGGPKDFAVTCGSNAYSGQMFISSLSSDMAMEGIFTISLDFVGVGMLTVAPAPPLPGSVFPTPSGLSISPDFSAARASPEELLVRESELPAIEVDISGKPLSLPSSSVDEVDERIKRLELPSSE